MKWKEIMKAPPTTVTDPKAANTGTGATTVDSDVGQTPNKKRDEAALRAGMTGKTRGSQEIITLIEFIERTTSQARTDTKNQRMLLGQIRYKIEKLGIPKIVVE